ncbi:ABC transporter ATP-binding protein [Cellulomonas triticagri]|uniref:ATP-binding cassette domain-containing protein n=1 Tax=Cellulomonas triticagri TaxID=2483352 RepID=A0A3M2JQG5_9CELL|nr:ATP-binding cassette domain-containing protein [Cellulomonas triticagri]RMI14060.1 ATP-binding cassette domain-containing protein [Cellulomonas triticagri]
MIEISRLTKRYSTKVAVADVTFTAPPGAVTGLIGPNGSGKSTTIRALLGLTRPTHGTATVDGCQYGDLGPYPLRRVGALLDNAAPVPERRGVDHLRWIAQTNGISRRRVDEVLEQVDLTGAARSRVKQYSLGMKQRLGIAAALLGDPDVLVLDEPMNGLDPEGIRWIRELLRRRTAEGATVLVSSHFMTELESVAERVVVLARGQVRAEGTITEVAGGFESLEAAYFHHTTVSV